MNKEIQKINNLHFCRQLQNIKTTEAAVRLNKCTVQFAFLEVDSFFYFFKKTSDIPYRFQYSWLGPDGSVAEVRIAFLGAHYALSQNP